MKEKPITIEKMQRALQKPLVYSSLTLLMGFIAFLSQYQQKPQSPSSPSPMTTADTYIPAGKTLIPIEITNYESLDSIIGQFGVVDLFTTPLTNKEKAHSIAFAVKILRAPHNPSHFAALVDQSQAQRILRFPGPFSVTVRNPKTSGTHFVKSKSPKKSRIFYNSD